MQINNPINSMVQLEKRLEQSANELSKLNLNNEQLDNENEKNLSKNSSKEQPEISDSPEIASDTIKQMAIPIAYTANAEVISTQHNPSHTTIDIKA